MSSVRRPVMRYHGGKWKLAPWIISHFPAHRVYVEPYGGGASVLLRKPRSFSEVYNDLSEDIANVFRVFRDPEASARLRELLSLTPYARAEWEASYDESPDPIERARRTLIRAYMGFGSASVHPKHLTGFRANANRNGTTPAHDWAGYPDHVPAIVRRLAGVLVECRPALDVIAQQDSPETLFYVDPPYPHDTRGNARGVRQKYLHEMNDDDHRHLAEVLRSVEGMVVVSGYPCGLYDRELFPDWKRVERATHADGARKRTEVLWLNPSAVEAHGLFAEVG